jgi:hypothetical protein
MGLRPRRVRFPRIGRKRAKVESLRKLVVSWAEGLASPVLEIPHFCPGPLCLSCAEMREAARRADPSAVSSGLRAEMGSVRTVDPDV